MILINHRFIKRCDNIKVSSIGCAMKISRVLSSERPASRVVQLQQGPVRGYRDSQWDLYKFYNLPYATAPQGKDRFKAPLPPPKWTIIREAVDQQIVCPQNDPQKITVNKTMAPACLIANVYVPDTNSTNLPVLVIFHGGAFQVGYGDLMTANNFLKNKKCIAVTFNYRLGPLGFLCLGTPNVPGNAGMKDQVALLRWVKENIAAFGGNPNDVTIEGYSAGSSSVDLMQLSKSAEGLFHKAIPESGSNLSFLSVQVDPIANAEAYAEMIGFKNVEDIHALEEFYTTIPLETLNKESPFNLITNNLLFAPCVERDTGVERFLESAPYDILKSGVYYKVPLLYGFANMEGLYRVYNNYDRFKSGMNEKFSNFLPVDLKFDNEKEKEEIAQRVKEFYFGDKLVGDDTILQFIDYYTDIAYAYPTLRAVTLQVQSGNDKVYLYQYSFAHEDAFMPPGVNAKVRGANHCAQTAALFDDHGTTPPGDEHAIADKIKEMKKIIREIWLSFITTGYPVPEGSFLPQWPAVSAARSPYMELTLPPQLHGELLPERARFWDDIYSKHYRVPAAPRAPPPSLH